MVSFVTFDGVVFEGVLDRVLFEGRKIAGKRDPGPMRNVDFRGVTFRHCDFRCQLENVTFDESPEIRVIRDFPAVLIRALRLARKSSDPEERDLTSLIEDLTTLKSELRYDSVFFPEEYASDDLRKINEAFGRLVDRAENELKSTAESAVRG